MAKESIALLHLASREENQGMPYAWSRTRMGGWTVAQSPILRTTITIKRLKMRGYVSLIEYYNK
jgi:RNA-directed DNA polymerase